MAYSNTLKLVVGDTLPELTFTLKDSNTAAAGYTLDADDASSFAKASADIRLLFPKPWRIVLVKLLPIQLQYLKH
jgi:hypothetical protein